MDISEEDIAHHILSLQKAAEAAMAKELELVSKIIAGAAVEAARLISSPTTTAESPPAPVSASAVAPVSRPARPSTRPAAAIMQERSRDASRQRRMALLQSTLKARTAGVAHTRPGASGGLFSRHENTQPREELGQYAEVGEVGEPRAREVPMEPVEAHPFLPYPLYGGIPPTMSGAIKEEPGTERTLTQDHTYPLAQEFSFLHEAPIGNLWPAPGRNATLFNVGVSDMAGEIQGNGPEVGSSIAGYAS
ncbi:hypothetical protein N7535_009051 [Penicillium sp. DV-2018c]|nr:hypothetical protein N7535_009051 [Penicillium sp. DV-2018c]